MRHTEEQHIDIPIHEECEVLMGMGMRADLQGNRLVIGSPTLMEQFGITVDSRARDDIARLHDDGHIAICCARNDDLLGVIGVTDAIRPEAAEVVRGLRAAGVQRVVMLTGDHPKAAAAVARALDITEFRAETIPDEKLAVVQELQAQGHVVAVVGDGINDAPALALADVGIAMGPAASDVAIETADVALAGNHLPEVVGLIQLGRHTLRVVRQNYGLAIGEHRRAARRRRWPAEPDAGRGAAQRLQRRRRRQLRPPDRRHPRTLSRSRHPTVAGAVLYRLTIDDDPPCSDNHVQSVDQVRVVSK